jgi:transaldolase/glucose-6-phosphate isomerase
MTAEQLTLISESTTVQRTHHPMANRIRKFADLGQAIWLDFISRDLLRSGRLRELINEGVTGMTSNPSIFQKSIAEGSEYDDQIRELAHADKNAYEIYEALTFRDIADAADQLRPIHNEKDGRDGFVSIEVDPKLAHDTERTIAEARRIFKAIDRPNVMIKVPATEAGIPAIRTLISEAVNVNVTLIFAISLYELVMQAYLDGLRQLRSAGRSIRHVASVASFFVSRVDTLVDRRLAERIEAGDQTLATLPGQAAVANAKIAYDRYQTVFESEAFSALRAAGARVQRPLWASTSTKNPVYPDTKYVDSLVGPNTVNTLPPHTLDALRHHGTAARTIDLDVGEAYAVVEKLGTAGIDMKTVTGQLLTDGVRLFAESFEKMLADIEAKRQAIAPSG